MGSGVHRWLRWAMVGRLGWGRESRGRSKVGFIPEHQRSLARPVFVVAFYGSAVRWCVTYRL